MADAAEFEASRRFLEHESCRSEQIADHEAWRRFKAESKVREWIYLCRFSEGIYAWGTCSNTNDRVRKSSLFKPKLTGKYDRRVDYLMLKLIHGAPRLWAFEATGATRTERRLMKSFGQRHCYRGLPGSDRDEISRGIVERFRCTPHYERLGPTTRAGFERYLSEVFFARRRHPTNPKRKFNWGDSLEPGFLRLIGLGELEGPVEEAFLVRF
ncbi:hypothetical protein [Corallococcus terminator]|uniref:Uncharacterized protein n=1 Tax=Corallococcus terminator TaxID=2316733 RepID=A0A3A8HYY1_9BACT|nr:hypothetical protein [Corallococcus terminator]RKG72680.1 hypothetical protein D7V88_37740 [Corallococcus terminator]